MKMLIIPPDRVEKLKSIVFYGNNILEPIKGVLDGKDVFFLQASLMTDTYIDKKGKEHILFADVLQDFEVCEQKEIATIEQKYYNNLNVEILPTTKTIAGRTTTVYLDKAGKAISISSLTSKTVLVEDKV